MPGISLAGQAGPPAQQQQQQRHGGIQQAAGHPVPAAEQRPACAPRRHAHVHARSRACQLHTARSAPLPAPPSCTHTAVCTWAHGRALCPLRRTCRPPAPACTQSVSFSKTPRFVRDGSCKPQQLNPMIPKDTQGLEVAAKRTTANTSTHTIFQDTLANAKATLEIASEVRARSAGLACCRKGPLMRARGPRTRGACTHALARARPPRSSAACGACPRCAPRTSGRPRRGPCWPTTPGMTTSSSPTRSHWVRTAAHAAALRSLARCSCKFSTRLGHAPPPLNANALLDRPGPLLGGGRASIHWHVPTGPALPVLQPGACTRARVRVMCALQAALRLCATLRRPAGALPGPVLNARCHPLLPQMRNPDVPSAAFVATQRPEVFPPVESPDWYLGTEMVGGPCCCLGGRVRPLPVPVPRAGCALRRARGRPNSAALRCCPSSHCPAPPRPCSPL